MSVSLSTVTQARNPRLLQTGTEFTRNFLNRQNPVEVSKLDNGFKVATQEIPSNGMATVAIHSKSGSRFDTLSRSGVSAVMQRALTKGTATRSAADVQKELRSLGADLQFTTDREHHAISLSCLGSDAPKAAALLADITLSPKLDGAAVDAARIDAIEALKESENSIPDLVMNNMYMTAYEATKLDETPGAGMCFNPLGLGEYLKTATAEDVKVFYDQYFSNANTVSLVATGDVDTQAVREAALKGFGSMQAKTEPAVDKRYTGGASRMDTGVPAAPYQQHQALVWEICPASSPDVIPLQLLLQVFGNYDRFHNDMTSNWGIRFNMERYSTQQGNSPLEEVKTIFDVNSDTGLMGFYKAYKLGGNDDEGWLLLGALQAEWCRYCMRLTDYQVEVGKNLLKSKMLFDNDGTDKANASIGKQLVSVGAVSPLEQNFARVDDLTTQQVSDVINHYYYDREPGLSAWGVYWTQAPYFMARRGTYKWRY